MDSFKERLCEDARQTIEQHQQGCWPVRNQTGRRWWQSAPREKEYWARVQVLDVYAPSGVRDIYLSSDGRIGLGTAHYRGSAVMVYLREEIPRKEWNLGWAHQRIIEQLPHLTTPGTIKLS